MNLGQFFSSAGVASEGIRQAEESERVARENQLKIEEQNRLAALKARMAQTQLPSLQAQAPINFNPSFAPGESMPMAAPVAAPVSAAAPVTSIPTMPPANEGLGVRRMTPAEVARLRQDPYAMGSSQPAMAPNEVQRERDRLALLKAPTLALDVVQAPMAGGLNLVTMAGEQVLNFGGRLINAVTGADVAPTDLRGPRFSISPFYDRYVKGPEEKLDARTQEEQRFKELKDKAETSKTAPTKPNKTALSYDNKVTPYDALIQQSATQYGIDPVVFKRLIGTESSFNPTAVSPRGEKFGLGIAQIADVHGLTREQRLNPNVAIPAGAQIFAAELQKANGNYEVALQRYKGASSEKGKASMAAPITTILSGLIPSAQAAPITPAAAPAALEVPKTQARNMEMAEFYLAKPESIPYEMQQLTQTAQQEAALLTRQRNEAAQLAQMYMQSGTANGIENAMKMRESIGQMDAGLLQLQQQVTQKQMYLQGMQGLRELAIANDPRRLAGVLTQYLGAPVGVQPRPDGLYNYFVNGKKVRDGISPAQLAETALRDFNPESRAAAAASAALENKLALELKYDPQRDTAKYKAAAELQKAIIDGEYKLAEERAKQLGGKLTVDTSSGVAYFTKGKEVFVITPTDTTEEIGGQTVKIGPRARPIAGLNTGR